MSIACLRPSCRCKLHQVWEPDGSSFHVVDLVLRLPSVYTESCSRHQGPTSGCGAHWISAVLHEGGASRSRSPHRRRPIPRNFCNNSIDAMNSFDLGELSVRPSIPDMLWGQYEVVPKELEDFGREMLLSHSTVGRAFGERLGLIPAQFISGLA